MASTTETLSETPTGLPVYLQISELLIREIAVGRLVEGQRLAPEREMAKDLGISVGTLRKALSELETKGLLERRQGSGNYIRSAQSVESLYSMFRLELNAGGGLPTAIYLDVSALRKPTELPAFGRSETGTRMRRLRFLNETPIAIEEIWLDGAAGRVVTEELSESLYHYYRTRLGFWISRAEDRVSIGTVPEWAPPAFGPATGATVGFVERLSWGQRSTPVEYSRTWFDTTKARYVQRLK